MLEFFQKLLQPTPFVKAASDTITPPPRKNAGIASIFGPNRVDRKRSYKITAERLNNMANTDPVIWSILKTRRDQVTQTKWDIVPDLEHAFAELDRWESIVMSNMNPFQITQEFVPDVLNKKVISLVEERLKSLGLDKVNIDDPEELKDTQKAASVLFEATRNSMTQDATIHANVVRKFLQRPNSTQTSFEAFIKLVCDDILKFDAGVIIKNKNRKGELAEIYTLPGQEIKVLLNEDGSSPVSPDPAYKYMPSGTTSDGIDFTNDELIYISDNPGQNGYGVSPLEIAIWIITASLYAENYNLDFLKHSNVPPGILSLGENVDETTRQLFQKQWEQEIKGAGGLHTLKFLAGASDPKLIPLRNLSNRDMQLMEYLKWTVSIKCMAYGISPQDIGFVQDFHRTTSETQKELSKSRGLKNLLSLLAGYLNGEIVKTEWDFDDVKFSWLDVDLEDATSRGTIDLNDLKAGVITINERRKNRGDKPIIGGDQNYIYAGATIIDIAEVYKQSQSASDEEPDDDPNGENMAPSGTGSPVVGGPQGSQPQPNGGQNPNQQPGQNQNPNQQQKMVKGGEGSGNFGHAGVTGQQGGSASGGASESRAQAFMERDQAEHRKITVLDPTGQPYTTHVPVHIMVDGKPLTDKPFSSSSAAMMWVQFGRVPKGKDYEFVYDEPKQKMAKHDHGDSLILNVEPFTKILEVFNEKIDRILSE